MKSIYNSYRRTKGSKGVGRGEEKIKLRKLEVVRVEVKVVFVTKD